MNATLRLFTDVEKQRARYVVSHGFFRKGEIADLYVLQLKEGSELTTRALAERVMRARDLDATDATLRISVAFKVVQALRHAARRKLVVMIEKRKGMCIWRLAQQSRCASPIALPKPANRSGQTITGRMSDECAVALPAGEWHSH